MCTYVCIHFNTHTYIYCSTVFIVITYNIIYIFILEYQHCFKIAIGTALANLVLD